MFPKKQKALILVPKTNNLEKNKEKIQEKENDKGNWEFSFFQKKYDPNTESNIKLLIRSENGFNPKYVHEYINPSISKEELILDKKNKGVILKAAEIIILENYINKQKEAIKNDIDDIKKHGLSSKPITKEGKTKLLLHILDYQIKKNNKELIANIYLRLFEDQFNITSELNDEYKNQIEYMNKIISEIDIIKLQFLIFHSQMPPLNNKGFKQFDEWQINVINNIDNNISTIINAPTSAGKSVLSGYTTTKGKVLFVVPTDALAWQIAAYIGNILDTNIPIITESYQTCPYRDKLIDILNNAPAITGTAESIVDYLPFIKNNFKWIVLDEVHMIGNPEGSSMEYIIKLLPNVPFLALSATISNSETLLNWFLKISYNKKKIENVVCTKRFFNLQRFYYDQNKNELITIHPLALIEESQIADGSLMLKSLQATPPNIWDLAIKLKDNFNLEDLCPYKYFSNKRIELDDAYKYFDKLISFIIKNYKTDKNTIMKIIDSYKIKTPNNTDADLVDLAFTLKNTDKTPVIIFQKNTMTCLKFFRNFARKIEELENNKYPKLYSDRLKQEKLAKKIDKKKNDNTDTNDKNNKKDKIIINDVKLKKDSYGQSSIKKDNTENIEIVSLQEPHPDFIFNHTQCFNEDNVEKWVNDIKKYFPNSGDSYHYIIKLLWRGVGIYAKGLPDPYLRLVQSLASQKQLAIVFSDKSLVFGVSMPFRTVVITKDKNNDDLDTMLFQQMCGRAGRRGLDKEGNIIFVDYSWNRIQELSISEPPKINGTNKIIYTVQHANLLSTLFNTDQEWDNIYKNFLSNSIDENEMNEILSNIKSNYLNSWNFAFQNDINHLYMNWKLRYNEDSILVSYLLPYLRREFENKDHTQEINQINMAHFLCKFFSIEETDDQNFILDTPTILNINPYNQIIENLENLQIEIPNNIDSKVFLSIQANKLVQNISDEKMKLSDLNYKKNSKSESKLIKEDYLIIQDINLDEKIFIIDDEFNKLRQSCILFPNLSAQ